MSAFGCTKCSVTRERLQKPRLQPLEKLSNLHNAALQVSLQNSTSEPKTRCYSDLRIASSLLTLSLPCVFQEPRFPANLLNCNDADHSAKNDAFWGNRQTTEWNAEDRDVVYSKIMYTESDQNEDCLQ
jgi:hypothetical protein